MKRGVAGIRFPKFIFFCGETLDFLRQVFEELSEIG
jgi:hypothetical protein